MLLLFCRCLCFVCLLDVVFVYVLVLGWFCVCCRCSVCLFCVCLLVHRTYRQMFFVCLSCFVGGVCCLFVFCCFIYTDARSYLIVVMLLSVVVYSCCLCLFVDLHRYMWSVCCDCFCRRCFIWFVYVCRHCFMCLFVFCLLPARQMHRLDMFFP